MTTGAKRTKEEVWPDNVENAFMEAIKEIPKLGRRKVPLNEKHYGRNELIAAYILKETQQARTRKQVSSHIQVLKNTRKDDLILMELLSDASPDESNDPEWLEAAMSKIRKIFDEESLQDAPPSPVSPISPTDSIYERFSHLGHHAIPVATSMPSRDDELKERRPTHNRQLSIASILNPEPNDEHHQLNNISSNQRMHSPSPQSRGTSDIAMQPRHDDSLPSNWRHEQYEQDYAAASSRIGSGSGSSWQPSYNSRHSPSRSPEHDVTTEGQAPMRYHSSMDRSHHDQSQPYPYDPMRSQISERYPFWPCQYQLILEEGPSQGQGRSTVLVENKTPFYDHLPCRDVSVLDEPRFPYIKQLFNEKRGALFLHTKLGLNLKDNSYRQVNLTSRNMYQSQERMTIQCVTNVYSFGKQVISSTETRPAEFFNGRYVYRIEMVDRWLQDYLQTLWEEGRREEEIESFLYNLTIVQEFSACSSVSEEEVPEEEEMEDVEDERHDVFRRDLKRRSTLLVVAFEFCAGQDNSNSALQSSSHSYRLTSGPPAASVRARSNTWDHPVPWHLSGYDRGYIAPGSMDGGSPWMTGRSHGEMYDDMRGGSYKRTSAGVAQREWPPQSKRSRKESFSGFSPYS
ncbi:hypothetical protein FBU30_007728 [Linnemannia zychae]|nr:hypothetical protein FBU30_007728 [Linnemannia zychae]